jgi:hypothetical protein
LTVACEAELDRKLGPRDRTFRTCTTTAGNTATKTAINRSKAQMAFTRVFLVGFSGALVTKQSGTNPTSPPPVTYFFIFRLFDFLLVLLLYKVIDAAPCSLFWPVLNTFRNETLIIMSDI